jgi:gliding motility-associated-like protein
MKKLILSFITFIFSIAIGYGQCNVNVNFNTWSKAGQPGNGNWSVQNGGSQVFQSVNGSPSFYISPFDLMNVKVKGRFKSSDFDDDWMGFVFSFLNPLGASDTFDCWLFDWKQEAQGAAPRGMSLCRANGYITNYGQTFDSHQNTPEFTVIDNNFGSAGWQWNHYHDIELRLTYTRAMIYVDGVLVFDHADCYKPGRFGFYNYSQKDCTYDNFSYDLFIDYFVTNAGKKCKGDTTTFEFVSPCSNASLAQYQSLSWDFGDGTTLVNNNPTFTNANAKHVYNTAGTFTTTLTVKDFNGCSATSTRVVTVANPITLTPTLTPPACNGDNTGTVSVNPAGGFGPYTYSWNGGANGQQTWVGRNAGTYTVDVNDGICSAKGTYTLTQPTALTATTSHTDASCGVGNGTATVVISGGTPPYQGVTWGPPPGGATATGLGAGTYIVDFKDANLCSSLLQYKETVAQLPCGISSSVTKTNVTCFGKNTGSATLTVTGGAANPVITWSPAGTGSGPTISNLVAGSYTYSYSDANPANAFSGTIVITQPGAAMVAQLATIGVSCAGINNGEAIASVTSGGQTPYSYAWSGGQPNAPTVTNLAPGSITVTVTDASSCSATATGVISGVPSLAVSMATINDSCFNEGKGSATATVTGGTGPYAYSWNNFEVTPDIQNLRAGTYTLTVTDKNNCTTTSSATISTFPLLSSSFVKQNIKCFGVNDGSYLVTPTGGVPGYTYQWSQGGYTGNNPTGLSKGLYSYTVTDAHGCSKSVADTVPLQGPDSALTALTSHTDVTCNGLNDGTVTITVAGGTPPYTYQGNPIPAGTNTLTALAPNTYAGTVTDANGCTAAVSETIAQPAVLSVTETHVPVGCFGASTGSITTTVTGGNTPYTYNWGNGITTPDRTSIPAGPYALTVTDAKSCTGTLAVTIAEPGEILIAETHTDVLCNGTNTGAIDITVSGGTAAYTYAWSDGPTTEDRTGLADGTYIVTVTDANGCTKSASIAIAAPPVLTASTSHTDVTCNGLSNGTITITVAGGKPPYSFLGNPVPAGTNTIGGLAPNTYAGNLADANGCLVPLSETIIEPAPFTAADTHTPASCFGASDGTITVTLTGGTAPFASVWSDGITTQNRTNLAAGTYSLTITDANGCTATTSATISQPTDIIITETHQNVDCNGNSTGSIDATASGGTGPYTYAWSSGPATEDLTGLAASTYILTVTDSKNCTKTLSVAITEPTLLTATTSHTNVTCNGLSNGTITITVAGGTAPYSFLGNPVPAGTNTLPGLAPNTYAGNLTDANGCIVAISETITEPAVLSTSETHTNVSCFGALDGAITTAPAGGTTPYSFAWSDGSVTTQNRTNIAAGNYTQTVTDANSCTATVSATISQPAAVPLQVTATDATCFGGNGSVTANPTDGIAPFTYAYSNSSITTQTAALPAGSYTATTTASNGCQQTATFTINQPAEIILQKTHTDLSCYNIPTGTVTITATGGTGTYTYAWSPNVSSTNTANALSAGTYSIVVTDQNGCTKPVSVTVNEPAAFSIAATPTDASCFGLTDGSIATTPAGGTPAYSYAASDGVSSYNSASGSFTQLAAGNYTITATDNNSCTATTATTVGEPAELSATALSTDALCYKSTNGTITITPVGGSPAFSYQLNSGTTNSSGLFTGLGAGNYTVTVTDSKGCTDAATATITEPDSVVVTVDPDPVVTPLGNPLQLNITTNKSGILTYSWSPVTALSCSDCSDPEFKGTNTTPYSVTVTTGDGCTGVLEFTATVISDYSVFIPNSFSPNNDGRNDFWQGFGNNKAVKQFEVQVFDRWGALVYQSNDVNFSWDGFTNGKLIDPGVYVYVAKYVWVDNHSNNDYHGTLTIIR